VRLALVLLALLLTTPAQAEPWYCPILRNSLASYGEKQVTDWAKARGYTDQQVKDARRECAKS